jgi:chromosome segregation ATPase
MHKNLVPLLVLASVAAGNLAPVAVMAGERPILQRQPELRDQMKDRREALKEEFKERISDFRKDRVRGWLRRMQARLGGLIDRLDRLADRIERRIQKAADAGKDVARARAALADARTKIAEARRSLDAMTAQLETILKDNPPREAFAKVKELQKGVFAKIREAHRALVHVLVVLRGNSGDASPTPTSTP